MNSVLIIALFIQIAMMIGGVIFLIETRRTIVPRSVWWAFLLNDLLWLLLIVDGIARLSDFSVLSGEIAVFVTFAISSLFLFRLVMRYKAHKQKLLLNAALLEEEQRLEKMRHYEESKHGHNWDNLVRFGFDMSQSVYHVERPIEVKHDT